MDDRDVYYDPSEGEQYPHKWGYLDTRFEFDSPESVRVTGNRYPICGYSMPNFLSFVEEVLDLPPIREEDKVAERPNYDLPDPILNTGFWEAVQTRFEDDYYSLDARERLIHSHGQLSVDEIYRIMTGALPDRVVDLVIYPSEETDVKAIIDLAGEHDVCLVPFGGGTNVSAALAVSVEEKRMTVSVDMRRMNRILWLDEENFLACVEAGISGKRLESELREKGYTSGHDPDSIEFSTLGGWIATMFTPATITLSLPTNWEIVPRFPLSLPVITIT